MFYFFYFMNLVFLFFFNATATTEIYTYCHTLSLHDALPISRDRFVMAMKQAVAPVGEARHDHDIFADIAGRLGFREAFTEGRTEMEWLRHLYDLWRQATAQRKVEVPSFDEFWAEGHVEIAVPDEPFVS